MPWKRISPLIIAVIAAVVVVITAIIVLNRPHKPPSQDAVTSVSVLGGTSTARMVKTAPAATIPDATALGKAAQVKLRTTTAADVIVHFGLDTAKLPKGEPACPKPTTGTNMAIAVFNQNAQAWIPLETTCASNELRAVVPHAGLYRAWLVPAGPHSYQWTYKGEAFAAHVTTAVDTPVTTYLAALVNGVGATFFNNLLAKSDDSPATCMPASTKYTVSVQASAYHPGTVAGCMANLHGTDQFKVRNSGGIPLAFGPQDAMRYLRQLSPGTNTDVYTLLEQTVGYARSTVVVPAHAEMPFAITSNAPVTVKIKAQVDAVSAMVDLAVAMLGVWAPQFLATNTTTQQLLAYVSQRLTVIMDMDGISTINRVDIQAAIREAAQGNTSWADHQENALKMVDLADCLPPTNLDVTNLVQTTFACLISVFTPDGRELMDLLTQLGGNAQQMQVQPQTRAQFKALAKATTVDVTLNKVFRPTEVYQPFIGDWRALDVTLHLYSNRTGRMDVKLGPCTLGPANLPTCWQHLSANVKVQPDGIIIRFGDLDVTDNADGSGTHYPNSLASGYDGVGDEYKLTLLHDGLIQVDTKNRHSQMCSSQATPDDRHACNI